MHWFLPWQHWLAIHTGTDNEPGPYYGFWSGFGSDIAEVAIIGGLVSMYRKHNCEVHGCWRLGRHHTAAGHSVCRKHHPDEHLTGQDVIDAHQAAQGKGDGAVNLPAFFPGAMRLAAAAQSAGFTQERVWPQVTDPAGVKWNPSGVLMALAVCGAESSGNSWATHQNNPQSIDFGPWQINNEAWPGYFDGTGVLSWARFWDNAVMAHDIFLAAGSSFKPWKGYTNGNWKGYRDPAQHESWLGWGHSGILALNKALAAGQSLGEIASVNLDVAP